MPASPQQTDPRPVAGKRSVACEVWRYGSGGVRHASDVLAVEELLQIRAGYGSAAARDSLIIATTMRTPGDDEDLALGYLYAEGIIGDLSDVVAIHSGAGVRVELAPAVDLDVRRLERYTFISSACGACGKQELVSVDRMRAAGEGVRVAASVLTSLPERLRSAQPVFEQTGGLHAAALFSLDGKPLLLREDVGRHNAVDKAIGAALRAGLDFSRTILLVSGRAGYELVQKAVAAGIPVLAAIGAPTSLAVETAEGADLTLCGFLREDRFNIYSAEWRLT